MKTEKEQAASSDVENPSLYQMLVSAGIEVSSHASDLYFPVTEESRRILERYEFKQNVTTFRNNIDGKLWYDAPFAFDPFWEEVKGKAARSEQ